MKPKPENLLRKLLHSKFGIILGFFTLVFSVYVVFGMAQKKIETARNKELVENQLIKLQNQQASLNSDIESLNTIEGRESAIREKFRVVKEGEGLIVIVDAPDQAPEPETNRFTKFFKGLFGKRK